MSTFFSIIGARVYPSSYFGDGAGPIVMNDVACLGSEFSLFDCDLSSNAYTEDNTGNYATIKCWKKGNMQSKANNYMYISSNPKRFGLLTAWTKHIIFMYEYLIMFIWNQFYLIFYSWFFLY